MYRLRKLAFEFGCTLEAGRESPRAGAYYSIAAGSNVAHGFYEAGADLIRESLKLEGAAGQSKEVLAAAAWDVAYAYSALQRFDDSLAWAAASHSIKPSGVSSESLARYYIESSPERSAYLYQKSYGAGLQEDYVEEGFALAKVAADLETALEFSADDPKMEAEIRQQIEMLVVEQPEASKVVELAAVRP